MRVVVATADSESSAWLRGVLGAAGLSVAILEDASAHSPELSAADLLIADAAAAASIGRDGPARRMLLVARGAAVDMNVLVSGGFSDVLAVPSPDDEILVRVGRALERLLRRSRPSDEPRGLELRTIVEQAAKNMRGLRGTAALEAATERLSVLMLLVDSHEAAEGGTPSHATRVSTFVSETALRMGLEQTATGWLALASRLHDVGLVALNLPLNKPTELDADTRHALLEHPGLGAEILEPAAAFGLPVDAVRLHHERVDGSGYPRGTDQVSLPAQILGAADVYEALTAQRPWREALTAQAALKALRGFDTRVVDALKRSVEAAP